MRHTMRSNQHQTPGLTLSRISKTQNHQDRLLGQGIRLSYAGRAGVSAKLLCR